MIEHELINSLDNCIDMLASGESIESCLNKYPVYAAALQPLLELGVHSRLTMGTSEELMRARHHVMTRMKHALNTPTIIQRPMYRNPLPTWAVRAVAVLMIILTSTALLAQNSLPGDLLYSTKRLTEDLSLTITGNNPEIQTAIEQRRRDETREVLHLGREIELVFTGAIQEVRTDAIVVSDIVMKIQPDTVLYNAYQVGDVVEVTAKSTSGGQLIGQQMRLMQNRQNRRGVAPILLTPTATPSSTMIPSPVLSLSLTPTISPSSTPLPVRRPKVVHGDSFDEIVPTLSLQSRHEGPEITATLCSQVAPSGWSHYRIQAGDTISGIALRFNVSVEVLIRFNCIVNPSLITIGTEIVVPHSPVDSGDYRGNATPDPANDQQNHGETDTHGGEYRNDDSGSDDKPTPERGGTPEDKSPHGKR